MDILKDTENKHRLAIGISSTFLLISLVCLIVNYSVSNSIDWSLYPIGGLIVVWATFVPLLILEKHKVIGLFVGLTITLIPFIFLIYYLSSMKGWFMPLALPVTVLFLLVLGICLMAFTNKKINNLYAAAITIFLFGVVVNLGVGFIINKFLNEGDIYDEYRVSTITISIILSLAFVLKAYLGRK